MIYLLKRIDIFIFITYISSTRFLSCSDFSQCTLRCFNLASKYLQFIFATFKKAKQAYCGPLYLLGPQLVLSTVLPFPLSSHSSRTLCVCALANLNFATRQRSRHGQAPRWLQAPGSVCLGWLRLSLFVHVWRCTRVFNLINFVKFKANTNLHCAKFVGSRCCQAIVSARAGPEHTDSTNSEVGGGGKPNWALVAARAAGAGEYLEKIAGAFVKFNKLYAFFALAQSKQ